MKDLDFIEACQEHTYGTSVVIEDEEGNEYKLEDIGTTQYGQFHLCLLIKPLGKPKDLELSYSQIISKDLLPLYIIGEDLKTYSLRINWGSEVMYYQEETGERIIMASEFKGPLRPIVAVRGLRSQLASRHFI